jgi:hypothetical protein
VLKLNRKLPIKLIGAGRGRLHFREKFSDVATLKITSSVQTALLKLKRAKLTVYDCQKQGASFIFCVKDKDIEKVFAIFKNPCYNITVLQRSKKFRLLNNIVMRFGLVIGCALFVFLSALSNTFVLKI